VTLRWVGSHYGAPAGRGFVGDRLVAGVSRFDVTDRPGSVTVVGHEWRAFVRGHPANGPVSTLDEAQRVAEVAYFDRVLG
jgi:hypothetical protein